MKAHWTRLKNSDEWGAKVLFEHPFESIDRGDTLTVTAKSGKEALVTVEGVLWTGEDKFNGGQRAALVAVKRAKD